MSIHTLDYYNQNAEQFISDTVSANMQDAYHLFLDAIKDANPKRDNQELRILDLGCGSGRDLKYFKSLGFDASGIDGSSEMVRIAREYSSAEVREVLFEDFHESNAYDGIWACASLLHLQKEQLPEVFVSIKEALRENGILYCSFKYGMFQGDRNGRYYTDLNEEEFQRITSCVSELKIIKMWISSDVRPNREDEKWLNVLMRKENHE